MLQSSHLQLFPLRRPAQAGEESRSKVGASSASSVSSEEETEETEKSQIRLRAHTPITPASVKIGTG